MIHASAYLAQPILNKRAALGQTGAAACAPRRPLMRSFK
jgi:hypothetical protein